MHACVAGGGVFALLPLFKWSWIFWVLFLWLSCITYFWGNPSARRAVSAFLSGIYPFLVFSTSEIVLLVIHEGLLLLILLQMQVEMSGVLSSRDC